MKRNLVAGKSVARDPASTNLTPIATAVGIMILCAASAVQAQEAAKPAAKPAEAAADTTVVVTGVRAALAQSLNQKRNADSHVEVITSEDVGKMPD